MTLNELKSLFSRFNIKPDKRLGQNFLLSEEVLDQIVAAAELTRQDTILEIGPGLGSLTKRLVREAGQVVAIEKDRKLARALNKIFKNSKNIKIIQGDALFMTEQLATGDRRLETPGRYSLFANRYKVVANIPYYLTGKILQTFLSSPPHLSSPTSGEELKEGGRGKPSLIVLLLQKEVAERIVAGPGEMSMLSVSVQFYADPEIIAVVSRENFYPPPEVDSAIVRLRVLEKPRFLVDERKFFQLVKIGFSNKRKQLHNNLRALGPSTPPGRSGKKLVPEPVEGRDYKKLLAELGLNPLTRAQDLSLEDWGRLYRRLLESPSPPPSPARGEG